jgi:hypothetical protein
MVAGSAPSNNSVSGEMSIRSRVNASVEDQLFIP